MQYGFIAWLYFYIHIIFFHQYATNEYIIAWISNISS